MNERADEQDVRRLLEDAVPPLPGPADRLAEVSDRVRRQRRRAVGLAGTAAAVAVALAVGVPALVVNGADGPADREAVGRATGGQAPVGTPTVPEPLAAGCPSTVPATGEADRPGLLVRQGATQVALCELPVSGLAPPDMKVPAPRVLTAGVDLVVNRLNGLETRQALLARLRAEAEKDGHDPQTVSLGCTMIGYPTALALVLRYPDGNTVVGLDRNCGTATTDGRTRYGGVLREFLTAYRTQLAARTDPATVRALACTAKITRGALGGDAELRDGIALNRVEDDPMLPDRLVALTACRYGGRTDVTLRRSVERRDGLDAVQTLVNRATTVKTGTDGNGTETVTAIAECANPGQPPPTSLDVLLLADATGAVSELRVWRAPCAAVLRSGIGPLTPDQELLDRLDAWLG